MNDVNLWSIIVASLVTFIVNSIWYSPILFGKEWLDLTHKKNPEQIESGGVLRKYIAHFIGNIISFAIFGFFISFANSHNVLDGAFFGFLIWLGFSAIIMFEDYLWNKTPFKLFMINSTASLISFVIGGAIIGAW